MLKIRVKYHLTSEGLIYFPIWIEDVLKETSKQDGFISMQYKQIENSAMVTLHFENSDKLNKWAETEVHNQLLANIEIYFAKPQEVAIEELVEEIDS